MDVAGHGGVAMPTRIDHPIRISYALGDVRRSREVTQVELAERLDVSQATVSKFEKSNPAVSTVRRYIEALGGRLELVAVFDEDEVIPLRV